MPEWWEVSGMASQARYHLKAGLYQLHFNFAAAGLHPTHGSHNRNSNNFILNTSGQQPPLIYLQPGDITTLGKQLFIWLPGTWILAVHFALHGHLATMTEDEYQMTGICVTQGLPPTCPMVFHSVNPANKSLAIIDRNKLTRLYFLDNNPTLSTQPRLWNLPTQWAGPCPAQEQAQFEARIMAVGQSGQVSQNLTPIQHFITQR